MVTEQEIMEVLRRIVDLRSNLNLLELDAIEKIEIEGSCVLVILSPMCACPSPFLLAARAEKEIKKLKGIISAKVEVNL